MHLPPTIHLLTAPSPAALLPSPAVAFSGPMPGGSGFLPVSSVIGFKIASEPSAELVAPPPRRCCSLLSSPAPLPAALLAAPAVAFSGPMSDVSGSEPVASGIGFKLVSAAELVAPPPCRCCSLLSSQLRACNVCHVLPPPPRSPPPPPSLPTSPSPHPIRRQRVG